MKNERKIRELKRLKGMLKLLAAYTLTATIAVGEYKVLNNIIIGEKEARKESMLKNNYDDFGKDKVKKKTKKK